VLKTLKKRRVDGFHAVSVPSFNFMSSEVQPRLLNNHFHLIEL
jgi:hypothetical protein